MNSATGSVQINPAPLAGTVLVAADKSISHRALMIAALSDQPVRVSGLSTGADVQATAAALEALGATVTRDDESAGRVDVSVAGPLETPHMVTVDCQNAGTGMRLLTGLIAGHGLTATLVGDVSLMKRPMGRVAGPLSSLGADVQTAEGGTPPVTIRPAAIRGGAVTATVASAQVKSALLLAGLGADGPVTVTLPARSRDHTEVMLRAAGITVDVGVDDAGNETVTVTPGKPSIEAFEVPADPSAAAFWWVAAYIHNTTVVTPQVNLSPRRTGALRILERMGAAISVAHNPGTDTGSVTIAGRNPSADTEPVTMTGLELVDGIDEVVVLAVAGALGPTGLVVTEAHELRTKESDRITRTVELLHGLGLRATESPDGFIVPGGQQPTGGHVESHHDHRLAMTAAIAATAATEPVTIDGFDAVATSYPQFLSDLIALGGNAQPIASRHNDARVSP